MLLSARVNNPNSDSTVIRSGPGNAYPLLYKMFNGSPVLVTDYKNDWYKHSSGWSPAKDFKIISILDGTIPKPVPPIITPPQPKRSTTVVPESTSSNRQQRKDEVLYDPKKLKHMFEYMGIYNLTDGDLCNKMHRFGFRDTKGIKGSREYLFFTKPDLNIYNDTQGNVLNPQVANNPIIFDIHKKCPEALYQLQSSVTKNKSPFMNLLKNTVKSKLDLPNITSKEIETSSTQFGTRMYYRNHSFESDDSHDFSLEFEDRKSLIVYYVFKAWNEYNNLKRLGVVSPRDIYRDNMELHDQISIYKILVSELGDEIFFYAKITGCFPKTVPRDVFSDVSEKLTYNIQWKGHFVEDMDPMIIYEFNKLTEGNTGRIVSLFNKETMRPDGSLVSSPFIETVRNTRKPGYTNKLKWRE